MSALITMYTKTAGSVGAQTEQLSQIGWAGGFSASTLTLISLCAPRLPHLRAPAAGLPISAALDSPERQFLSFFFPLQKRVSLRLGRSAALPVCIRRWKTIQEIFYIYPKYFGLDVYKLGSDYFNTASETRFKDGGGRDSSHMSSTADWPD